LLHLSERRDFLPKYTQIQLQIILFLLFWDVLWIINDLLAPLSLFFHEFQQNSQVFTDNIKRSRSWSGRLQSWIYPNIHLNFSFQKSDIYKLFFIFLQKFWYWKHSSLFKTYAVDLRRLLCQCEQVVCLITGKKRSILIISRFHIYFYSY
jgi:hypothetical protein